MSVASFEFCSPLVAKAAQFARAELDGYDASHDYWHALRVCANAHSIAAAEAERFPSLDREMVEIAALLHDVGDYKYTKSETVGPAKVRAFLLEAGVDAARAELVVDIMSRLSFRKELASAGDAAAAAAKGIELCIVQDADRLDAIGAIGIARTFAYGAATGSPFYNPDIPPRANCSASDYKNTDPKQTSTLNHFSEKLFLLKGLMNTESAKRIAEGRDAFMHSFVEQFMGEWNGTR